MTTDVHTPTADRLYGPQTELGVRNFPLRGRTFGDLVPFVRNYALVKLAAARVNHAHGVLDEARRDAIVTACQEIADGAHTGQFPTPLARGGRRPPERPRQRLAVDQRHLPDRDGPDPAGPG